VRSLTVQLLQLARAGFFYIPALDSEDNVKCFCCAIKLDGWEPSDDPISEHLAHARNCSWALSLHSAFAGKRGDDDAGDPMSDELLAARKGTFMSGGGWPHEDKKGWKCRISKMAEAGWIYDPAPADAADVGEDEEADGVTCFYCDLSLDGWEPKDDPKAEHQRRSPDCAFFALVEKYGSGAQKKTAKGRGKKGVSRASTASKASSRLSTQSGLSTFSQDPSLADIGMDLEMDSKRGTIDDSVMSTASQSTATGTTKGKKKGGRAKAAAKGTNGRKRAETVDSQAGVEPLYPELNVQSQLQQIENEEIHVSSPHIADEQPEPAPAKKGRKGTKQSKQPQFDSSVVEISSMDVSTAPKKVTRGRKAKPQPQPDPEPDTEAINDNSDVSAQLQEELERSMDFDAQGELDESTPQILRPKRGVKRTSEGLAKVDQAERSVSNVIVDFHVPPKAATGPKGKRGRQASKQIAVAEDSQSALPDVSTQEDTVMSEAEAVVPKATEAKKAPAKGKGKGRKASSTRSSRSSKATIIATEPAQPETQEDLERDEREIEAELERIATEQAALQAEQENVADYEPSPSQKQVESATNSEAGSRRQSTKGKPSLPPQLPPIDFSTKNATPSPTGSDKENLPSSAIAKSTAKQPQLPIPVLSPTKTTRIPLAPGTPNRTLLSPSKRLSPTKQLRQLTSTQPWQPIDIENVLLASPQPTPGTLATRLAGVAGALTSPEKALTVEGWVMYQAEKADAELKRKCEEMVGVFEREGVRALGTLQGIVVGGL
jgi:hypothetical protein